VSTLLTLFRINTVLYDSKTGVSGLHDVALLMYEIRKFSYISSKLQAAQLIRNKYNKSVVQEITRALLLFTVNQSEERKLPSRTRYISDWYF
jgi:hypothetical protein